MRGIEISQRIVVRREGLVLLLQLLLLLLTNLLMVEWIRCDEGASVCWRRAAIITAAPVVVVVACCIAQISIRRNSRMMKMLLLLLLLLLLLVLMMIMIMVMIFSREIKRVTAIKGIRKCFILLVIFEACATVRERGIASIIAVMVIFISSRSIVRGIYIQ